MEDGPRSRPTSDEIHHRLRRQILLLDLPPGERLREEHLADQFGVSRTPVRQALDRLEFEGLGDQAPGAGSSVSTVDMKVLRDVWAVRFELAEIVGNFVRPPAPTAVLENLIAIRDQIDEVRGSRDVRALGTLYHQFDDLMLEVIDNTTLRQIHDLLFVRTARVWMQFLPEMDLDAEIQIMADEIDQTLDSLRGSSGRHFADVRTKHMRMLLDRFNQHLTSALS